MLAASPPGHTVLIVDDDAAVRGALKFALEVEGFQVRLYPDAPSILADRALPLQGCLVIEDRMPGMDGLELIERLRACDVCLPVILIGSAISGRLRQRARQVGVHAVLEKPLFDGALVESIRRTT